MGYILHTVHAERNAQEPADQPDVRFDTTSPQEDNNADLNREETIHEIFREARIWSLILLLSKENFSTDTKFVKDLDKLRRKWLRTVDHSTFHSIIWNIAHRLLYRGLGKPDYTSADPQLSDDDAIRISDNDAPPEAALRFYRAVFPELFQKSTDLRTWIELKYVAAKTDVQRNSIALDKHLANDQALWTRQRLGLRIGIVDSNVQNALEQDLMDGSHKNAKELAKKHDLAQKSAILVECISEAVGMRGATLGNQNVLSLYPLFFESCTDPLITSFTPSGLPVRNTQARPSILIHEMTHSGSSISTTDTKITTMFRLTPEEVERDSQTISNTPMLANGYYGWSCLDLVAWDKQHATQYAEGNADNWAMLCNSYMLHLAYPEYDFPPGVRTLASFPGEDGYVSQMLGSRREVLRHHSSLLDILRHPDVPLIRDLPGYDKGRDPYWSESAGWTDVPKTREDLLRLLINKTDSQAVQISNINTRRWAQFSKKS